MTIQSVRRASQVLGLFTKAKPRLGSTEISKALGIHKATVQGLVRTLFKEGLLDQDPETRKYHLGLKIYELGMVLSGSLEINQKASGPAHQLALTSRFLVRVAIPDMNTAIITLDAYPRTQPFIAQHLGVRFPLYCTAMGKAILAYFEDEEIEKYLETTDLFEYTPNTITQKDELLKEIEKIRKVGYTINREEHFLSRASIGAPIFGANNKVVAATCIVGEPNRILGEEKNHVAQMITMMALTISQSMGFFPKPTM
jgi:IclR family KDG regulon transcriptional repressor